MDTMVEQDEDEWLGPRASSMTCHLNGLMMSEVISMGLVNFSTAIMHYALIMHHLCIKCIIAVENAFLARSLFFQRLFCTFFGEDSCHFYTPKHGLAVASPASSMGLLIPRSRVRSPHGEPRIDKQRADALVSTW